MIFTSWNVNGIRACIKHGFKEVFDTFDADIFAIQETKCQEGQLVLELEGYYQYFNYALRKGYSGTAVFTKQKPKTIIRNLWDENEKSRDETKKILDNEGRLLALEFDNYWFVCVYTPNAQKELARIEPRLVWGNRFREFCKSLENRDNSKSNNGFKPVIMCGDFNVAHNEIDLKNPKQNIGNAGFSDEERQDFTNLLNSGFTDSFRKLYPDKLDAYSWWSYRARSRARNVGWRIDYFLTSDSIADRIKDSVINSDVYGSDHCPITLNIDI